MTTGTIRNEDILADIYANSSLEYQHRVPDPTKASLEDSMAAMLEYSPIWNEFQHQLINRIGSELIRATVWDNPLAIFKNPAMMYGATIEEIKAGLIQARTYSADRDYLERDLFGQAPLDIQTAFHSINREDMYKLTVNEQVLKRAFLNPTGLNKLLVEMMKAPSNSDNWDEFVIMASLFKQYDKLNGFHKVQVPDITTPDATEAEAKYSLRQARIIAGNLKFLSTKYNAARMPVAAQPDELVIFATPEWQASVDVEALAGAFNQERMDVSGRIIELPKDHFDVPGAQAIITTKDFFICNDTLLENRSQPNAAGLYTNFFFHHHGIYSASRFAPAVMLTSHTVETIEIQRVPATTLTVDDIVDSHGATVENTVRRDSNAQILWTVGPENATDTTVIWSLSGANSTRTRVDQNGIIHISGTETAGTVTVVGSLDTEEAGEPITRTVEVAITITGDVRPEWPNT